MKKESKLAKILVPKLTSFLPIGLGINVNNNNIKYNLKRYDILRKYLPNREYDEKQVKIASAALGVGLELLRDIPTAAFLWAGDTGIGLGYYAGASYLIDKVTFVS